MTERLAVSRSVTLDAAGSGTLTIGPSKYAEKWTVTRMTTSGNSAASPQLRIRRGGQLLDSTSTGNADISDTSELELMSGETITASYALGTTGAIMTLYMEGLITRGV